MLEQPSFGQRLKALRLERGMSQAALAGDEMSTPYLSRLESGARPPTPRVVKYLAERLKVPPAAFDHVQDQTLAQTLAAVSSVEGEDMSVELAEALRAESQPVPALQWQALWLLARHHGAQGRHEEEYQLLLQMVELAGQLALPELRVRTITQLSRCARVLGDNSKARQYAAEAVDLSADLGLSDRTAALHALVSAEAEAGQLLEARARADELVKLTESGGGTAFTRALWASATVSIRQGAYAEARVALERALENLNSHDDLDFWMRLRLAAASLYLQITPAETAAAKARLTEIEPVVKLIGTELNRQEMLSLSAHLAFSEGRYAEALELCDAVELDRVQLSFRDRLRLRALRNMLRILDGETEAAVLEMQQLAQQAHAAHSVELAAEIWRNLAETLAKLHGSETGHRAAPPL